MIHYHNCDNKYQSGSFQNGSKFLKKVTIGSKNFNTVEINVSIFSEAVVGALVGSFFCSNDENKTDLLLEG